MAIGALCQWDVLVFLDRHQSSLLSVGHIALFLSYANADVVAALDSVESSGLVERSRVSQGARLYQLTAPAEPTRCDALERLMTLADSRVCVCSWPGGLRGSDRPDQNKNDFRLRGAKGNET